MNRNTRKLVLRRLTIGTLQRARGGLTIYVSYNADCSFSCTTCVQNTACNPTIGRCIQSGDFGC